MADADAENRVSDSEAEEPVTSPGWDPFFKSTLLCFVFALLFFANF